MTKPFNEMWRKVFPDLDFTEYHPKMRRKPIQKMSLAEFIVFSRSGFLLLYPARYWLISLTCLISYIFIELHSFLGIFNAAIMAWALYRTFEVVMLIRNLPDSTVFYDVEIREDPIFKNKGE